MPQPRISIVLPTYDRERFLPQAFRSIRSQRVSDWELIVVDDGSRDRTRELVSQFAQEVPQQVQYVYQENQGFFAARTTGIRHATGQYLAFFDSDDLWLDHHLCKCVQALDENSDIDWVFSPSRLVELETGSVVAGNSFYDGARPLPFLTLRTESRNGLNILDDRNLLACTLTGGVNSGFQCSVVRSSVAGVLTRGVDNPRDVSVDQYLVARAVAEGFRFAYFTEVHVLYQIHKENCSAVNLSIDLERKIRVHIDQALGFERLGAELQLTRAERRALRRRVSEIYFWLLGYSLFWQNQRASEALQMFWKGIYWWPWEWRYWKTLSLATVRAALTRGRTVEACD